MVMAERSGSPLLQVQSASKSFPVGGTGRRRVMQRAVDGASVTVDEGETLGIVGESGSGKTTLGRMIAGLERPDEGEILIGGAQVENLARTRNSRVLSRLVQMIFQDSSAALNPRMTVGAILQEVLYVHHGREEAGRDRAGVRELLEKVGLPEGMLERYAWELSGGQLQRVCIARALAVNARILVCDEPVSALDVSIQAQVLNLLVALQRETGMALVFISHDIGVIQYVSQRVAVMYSGRIIEEGPTEAVVQSPMHPYTQTLLRAVPEGLEGRHRRAISPARKIESMTAGTTADWSGCAYRRRCERATEICEEKVPQWVAVGEVRRAFCHHAGEDGRDREPLVGQGESKGEE